MISDFRRKHRAIDRYFYTGYGVKLQYLDSQVAERVMMEMFDCSIAALPVHDSFIVARTCVVRLTGAMLRAYEEVCHDLIGVKFDCSEKHLEIIWPSPECENGSKEAFSGYYERANQYCEKMSKDDFEKYERLPATAAEA